MTLLLLLCLPVIIILMVCAYVFRICFYSPKDRTEDPYTLIPGEQYKQLGDVIIACTRVMDTTPCEWVKTQSFDGLDLSARYYHTADDAPTVIVMHGYHGNALRDGAGGFALAKKLGFNILVPDQRAHARSGGRVITFGIRERKDCASWVEYANARFGVRPVILAGLSMGAATVLMASDLDLPENVVGIMADCPYSSPAGIIRKVCKDRRLPDRFLYPFIKFSALLFGGFQLEETSAVQAVGNTNIPILLFHGDDDRFVPWEMSKKIASACVSPVQLEIIPDAGHGLCYMMDPVRYETSAVRFLWKIKALETYLIQNNFALKHR